MTQLSLFSQPDPQFTERIRRTEQDGKSFYSLVDIMAEFSDLGSRPDVLWKRTRERLEQDGFQLDHSVIKLKLTALDGKKHPTDCADTETCLRIVQSIPSPKAEPIRQWLAQIAAERLEEAANPALGIERAQDRAAETYKRQGKEPAWITARVNGIGDRKDFTDALARHVANIGVQHYGIATNKVYTGLWGRDAKTLREQMGLPKAANLRDHQSSIANHYQSLVEITVSAILDKEQTVSPQQAMAIIEKVARILGVQSAELGSLLGIDIATGMPLLENGDFRN